MIQKLIIAKRNLKKNLLTTRLSMLFLALLIGLSIITLGFPAPQKAAAHFGTDFGTVDVQPDEGTYCTGITVMFIVNWQIWPTNVDDSVLIDAEWGDGTPDTRIWVSRDAPARVPHKYDIPGRHNYNFELIDNHDLAEDYDDGVITIIDDKSCKKPLPPIPPRSRSKKEKDEERRLRLVPQPAQWSVDVLPNTSTQRKIDFLYGDGLSSQIIVPADPNQAWLTYTFTHEYPLNGRITAVNGVNQRKKTWTPFVAITNLDPGLSPKLNEYHYPDVEHLDEFDPTKPEYLSADVTYSGTGSTNVQLKWSQSLDNVAVIGYKVFRNNQQIANVTSWNTGSVVFLVKYDDVLPYPRSSSNTYKVQAYDGAGNHSVFSDDYVLPASQPIQLNKNYNELPPTCWYCTPTALVWTPPDGPTPIAYRIYVLSDGDYSDPNPQAPCSAAGTTLVETVSGTTYRTSNAPCGLADGYMFGNWIFNHYYVVPVYDWGTGPASNMVYSAWMTYYQDPNGCC